MLKNNQKPARQSLRLPPDFARTKSWRAGRPMAGGYVIGADGGGVKTIVVLADLKRKVLAKVKTGPSNPNNVGIKIAAVNISEAIKKATKKIKKGEIVSTYIALAGIKRNKKKQTEIKKALLSLLKISHIFKGRVTIDGDQKIAFRSGTDEKKGILLISGAGCVAGGWRGDKEVRTSGWGYLNDEGSGFWIGQKAYQAICKDLDGRGSKTLLTKLTQKKWNIRNGGDLMRKVYEKSNPVEIISSLVPLVDAAAKNRDKIAKSIVIEAGKELALAAKIVIKKLNFQKEKFPVVLIGGTLKSKIVLNEVKKEIKKVTPKAKFIQPKQEPVMGAVKLAIEQISK